MAMLDEGNNPNSYTSNTEEEAITKLQDTNEFQQFEDMATVNNKQLSEI